MGLGLIHIQGCPSCMSSSIMVPGVSGPQALRRGVRLAHVEHAEVGDEDRPPHRGQRDRVVLAEMARAAVRLSAAQARAAGREAALAERSAGAQTQFNSPSCVVTHELHTTSRTCVRAVCARGYVSLCVAREHTCVMNQTELGST